MPVVTLRLMELTVRQHALLAIGKRYSGWRSLPMNVSVHVPHAAKDREQNSQGQVSWLLAPNAMYLVFPSFDRQ